MAVAKGSALLATLGFVKDQFGSAVLQQIVDRLPAAEQEIIRSASATREIAFSLLLDVWRASDAVLRVRDHEWMERAGAHSIDSMGTQLYGGIVRKATPLEFLNQRIRLVEVDQAQYGPAGWPETRPGACGGQGSACPACALR